MLEASEGPRGAYANAFMASRVTAVIRKVYLLKPIGKKIRGGKKKKLEIWKNFENDLHR